jgi:hypothetical protein
MFVIIVLEFVKKFFELAIIMRKQISLSLALFIVAQSLTLTAAEGKQRKLSTSPLPALSQKTQNDIHSCLSDLNSGRGQKISAPVDEHTMSHIEMSKVGKILCGRQTTPSEILCRVEFDNSWPALVTHTMRFVASPFTVDGMGTQTIISVQGKTDKHNYIILSQYMDAEPELYRKETTRLYNALPANNRAMAHTYVQFGKQIAPACNALGS